MSEFPGVKEIAAADLMLIGAPILQEAFEAGCPPFKTGKPKNNGGKA